MESQAETLGAKIETGEEIQNIETKFFLKWQPLRNIDLNQLLLQREAHIVPWHRRKQELIGSNSFCATCDGAFIATRK
jgi:hypothetical protein